MGTMIAGDKFNRMAELFDSYRAEIRGVEAESRRHNALAMTCALRTAHLEDKAQRAIAAADDPARLAALAAERWYDAKLHALLRRYVKPGQPVSDLYVLEQLATIPPAPGACRVGTYGGVPKAWLIDAMSEADDPATLEGDALLAEIRRVLRLTMPPAPPPRKAPPAPDKKRDTRKRKRDRKAERARAAQVRKAAAAPVARAHVAALLDSLGGTDDPPDTKGGQECVDRDVAPRPYAGATEDELAGGNSQASLRGNPPPGAAAVLRRVWLRPDGSPCAIVGVARPEGGRPTFFLRPLYTPEQWAAAGGGPTETFQQRRARPGNKGAVMAAGGLACPGPDGRAWVIGAQSTEFEHRP